MQLKELVLDYLWLLQLKELVLFKIIAVKSASISAQPTYGDRERVIVPAWLLVHEEDLHLTGMGAVFVYSSNLNGEDGQLRREEALGLSGRHSIRGH